MVFDSFEGSLTGISDGQVDCRLQQFDSFKKEVLLMTEIAGFLLILNNLKRKT